MISLFFGSSPAREPISESGIERAPWAWLPSYASLLRTSTSTASSLTSAWRASSTEIRRAVSWVGVGVIWGFSAGAAACGAANAGAAASASSTPPASARPLRNIRCILGPPGRQPLAGAARSRPHSTLEESPAGSPASGHRAGLIGIWQEESTARAREGKDSTTRPALAAGLFLRVYYRHLRGKLQIDHHRDPAIELEEGRGVPARQDLRNDRHVLLPQLADESVHLDPLAGERQGLLVAHRRPLIGIALDERVLLVVDLDQLRRVLVVDGPELRRFRIRQLQVLGDQLFFRGTEILPQQVEILAADDMLTLRWRRRLCVHPSAADHPRHRQHHDRKQVLHEDSPLSLLRSDRHPGPRARERARWLAPAPTLCPIMLI